MYQNHAELYESESFEKMNQERAFFKIKYFKSKKVTEVVCIKQLCMGRIQSLGKRHCWRKTFSPLWVKFRLVVKRVLDLLYNGRKKRCQRNGVTTPKTKGKAFDKSTFNEVSIEKRRNYVLLLLFSLSTFLLLLVFCTLKDPAYMSQQVGHAFSI